jgi:hypothetical protein
MNTRKQASLLFLTVHTCVLSMGFCWIVGCSSSGYHKSDVAGQGLQKAAAEVDTETRQIETTLAALKDLVEAPAPDLKPQFRRFSANLDRLIDAAERTDKTGKSVELKNAAYIAAWERDTAGIHYGVVRERSEARKTEVTNQLHAVNVRYQELQAVVWPLITYFNDVRTALSVDLTAGGLESVKSIVNNADQNAQKVQSALARLSNELTASGTSLSSVGVRTAVRAEESVLPANNESARAR